ncbi:YbcC family protein [Cognatishimia sp. F0-27]|uniref:YbcC family protein n=1 Tax=Cognatishimia sp. F0-27 TaxID=2816855 RepID=UPI001D0C5372|nr:DUF2309 domain-containing protein [Cognatishimia sp. F0-27]MCC1491978.1 DUF2309 domain-containing protein [Cognatishimia sp. F0-27]
MSLSTLHFQGATLQLFAAAENAIAQIPPAFPLAATVAVNPFLGQAGEPRALTAARMEKVAGLRILRPRAELKALFENGTLTRDDLALAIATDPGLSVEDLLAALDKTAPAPKPLPTVTDLAEDMTGIGWNEFVEDRIGAFCAAYFDEGQAFWPAPQGGLYEAWRAFASRDLTPGIAGLSGFAQHVADLPDSAKAGFEAASQSLGLDDQNAPLYFHRLLMSLGGWAQYARHIGWTAERDGQQDSTTQELLTIRLVFEAALLEKAQAETLTAWAAAREDYATPLEPSLDNRIDAALQEAADRSAERRLKETLEADAEPRTQTPDIQAAFCIDVRSEPFRRALEAADAGIATKGFAGFFGLAVTHHAEGSDIAEARAPVLLNPGLETTVAADTLQEGDLRITRRATRAWGRFKMAAVSAFAFVEAAGPLYLGKLLRDSLPAQPKTRLEPAPRLTLTLADRIAAAKTVLGAMSLTEGFGKVVLIAGHGATVTNAPHASALQCGACGGHAGDVNARLLAGLLNDAEVRGGLALEGIAVPAETVFVAGLHDTVTDEVTLYEDAPIPAASAGSMKRLKAALKTAARSARTARALLLPRASGEADVSVRGGDWSELRPEWGLAGCQAFLAAPRMRSVGRDLGGRVFLHDYDHAKDDGYGVLELILTAPVVVASWISLQYHGSALAPEAFGGGNKLLHNVTAGIGVVEGNGGLLRAGLPRQSVHDGDTLRHEPVRLSVIVAAPTEAIQGILDKHPQVRALFDNGWLALSAMDDEGRVAHRYDGGGWVVAGEAARGRAEEQVRAA